MTASLCTAKVTGKHRNPWRKAKCPACGKRKSANSRIEFEPKNAPYRVRSAADVAGVHPSLAKEVEGLHHSRLFEIAGDPDADPLMLAAVAAETTDDQLRSNIIRHQNVNGDVLKAVYASAVHPDRRRDEYAERDVASHPETPDSVLIDIAQDGQSTAIFALTERDSIPEQATRLLLARASGMRDRNHIKQRVASQPSTDVSHLEELIFDKNLYVRTAAAGNVNLPLASVTDDMRRDFMMRAAVASRSDLSETALRRFADDGDDSVVAAVLANPIAPQGLLMSNIRPINAMFRAGSQTSANAVIASNHGASVEVLREVAKMNNHHSLSRALAENPRCPGDVLEGIVDEHMGGTAAELVSEHPNTPLRVLPELMRTHPHESREARRRVNEHMDSLGVDRENDKAREMLFDQEWWNMTAASDEVFIALQMFNNPER